MIREPGFCEVGKMRIILVSASVLVCGIYVFLCTVNILLAFAFAIIAVVGYIFFKNPDLSFLAYVLLLPFIYSPFFYALPGVLSALKLLSLLLIITMGLFVLCKRIYRTGVLFAIFAVILVIIYAIGWIRSTDYMLEVFSGNLVGKLSIISYLLNYTSWTVLSFTPLLIIAIFYRSPEEVEKVIGFLAYSTILIAGFLMLIFVIKVNDRTNFETIRFELAAWMGIHGNDISNYCILSFTVILAWSLSKKSALSVLSLAAIIVSTLLCFSRTGYFLILAGLIMFFALSGRLKWIPIIAAVLTLVLVFFIPDIIIERASTGISSGDANEISAGRVDYLWIPLLHELINNPKKALFGMGRFGITQTDSWMQGRILKCLHAHNIYLDCVLDTGIIGLGIIITLFTTVIIYYHRTAKRIKESLPYYSNLLNGCLVSIICFLIGGMTGRSFFPNQGNFYLWIVIGLGFSVTEYVKTINYGILSNETGGKLNENSCGE
jgi:hypothetical protein